MVILLKFTENFNILINANKKEDLIKKSLEGKFVRRYLPSFKIKNNYIDYNFKLNWKYHENFKIEKVNIENEEITIKSREIIPYSNESPVFLLLQLLNRIVEKKKYLCFADSCIISNGKEGILILGPPHSGKSSISFLSIKRGFIPLSSETSIVKINNGKIKFSMGNEVLIVSNRIFGEEDATYFKNIERTRSGYIMIDLKENKILRDSYSDRIKINYILIIHSNLKCKGFDLEKVGGRKLKKYLWYYSSLIIKGVDYYEEFPLNLSDVSLDISRITKINSIVNNYKDAFFEVYGDYESILNFIEKELL